MNEPWQTIFLAELKRHGLINTAATAAGVTRRKVDNTISTDAEFEYAVDDALEAAADELEIEARRRAVEGVEKGVYYQGERTDTETVYSDGLLTTLLKAKRADEFAERKQITGAGGKPLTVVVRSFGPPAAQQSEPLPLTAEFTRLPAPGSSLELADVLDMV